MGSYTSELPATGLDPAYQQFFENFYKISDTASAHEQYAAQFTKNATLVMASKKVEGTDQIIALRHGMWEKVQSRAHNPIKIFPFGTNSNEVMLYGIVDYVLKAGGSAQVPWAARAVLTKDEGPVKMSFYQVYLDTAAQSAGK